MSEFVRVDITKKDLLGLFKKTYTVFVPIASDQDKDFVNSEEKPTIHQDISLTTGNELSVVTHPGEAIIEVQKLQAAPDSHREYYRPIKRRQLNQNQRHAHLTDGTILYGQRVDVHATLVNSVQIEELIASQRNAFIIVDRAG